MKSGIFPIKETQGKRLKILTSKRMLQRLPISIAQVTAGYTPENFLNETRQIIYSLYQGKEILKESIKQNNEFNKGIIQKMNTIFMNSKNSKTSDPHRLSHNLTDKINLKRSDKYVALSILSIYYTWKYI